MVICLLDGVNHAVQWCQDPDALLGGVGGAIDASCCTTRLVGYVELRWASQMQLSARARRGVQPLPESLCLQNLALNRGEPSP